VCIVLTVGRNAVWANGGTLWSDHLEDYPGSFIGLYNKAFYHYNHRELDEVGEPLAELLKRYPNFDRANYLAGRISLLQGNYQQALVSMTAHLEINPVSGMDQEIGAAFLQLGVQTFDSGRLYQCPELLYSSLKFIPNTPELHNNIGYALYRTGNYQEAVWRSIKPLSLIRITAKPGQT